MKKIFISYVRENRKIIDNICERFEEANIEYWLDRKDIDPGKDWRLAIKKAIKEGSLFLACFSTESVSKETSYMNEELCLAIEILRQKRIDAGWFIPVRLNKCEIPDHEISSGRSLNNIQRVDLFEEFEEGLKRLIEAIRRRLNIENDHNLDNKSTTEYKAFKSLIDSGSNEFFHNADMGHPVYMAGATGSIDDFWKYADGPERNILFKKLSELSDNLKNKGIEDSGYRWWYDFSSWESFCRYVVNAYRRKHGFEELE